MNSPQQETDEEDDSCPECGNHFCSCPDDRYRDSDEMDEYADFDYPDKKRFNTIDYVFHINYEAEVAEADKELQLYDDEDEKSSDGEEEWSERDYFDENEEFSHSQQEDSTEGEESGPEEEPAGPVELLQPVEDDSTEGEESSTEGEEDSPDGDEGSTLGEEHNVEDEPAGPVELLQPVEDDSTEGEESSTEGEEHSPDGDEGSTLGEEHNVEDEPAGPVELLQPVGDSIHQGDDDGGGEESFSQEEDSTQGEEHNVEEETAGPVELLKPDNASVHQMEILNEATGIEGDGLTKRRRSTSTDDESELPPSKVAKSSTKLNDGTEEEELRKMTKDTATKLRSLSWVAEDEIRKLSYDLMRGNELHIAVAVASIRRSTQLILEGLDDATRAAIIGEMQRATYGPAEEPVQESNGGRRQQLGALVRDMTSILRSITRPVEQEMTEIALGFMQKHPMHVAVPAAVIIRSTQLILDAIEVRFQGSKDLIIACLRVAHQPPQDDLKPIMQ